MAANDSSPASAGDNSDDSASTIVGALMIVLAIIAVALRLYSRLHLKQRLMWDDWFIFISLASFIAAAILVLVGLTDNPNTDWVDDSLSDLSYIYTPANQFYLLCNWIASIFYFCIVCPAKISVLFMYNRIFSVSRLFRWWVYILSVAVGMFWIGNVLAEIFTCVPLRYSWETARSPAAYCFNSNLWWLANGLIELVFDVIIICLPLGMVARLHMSLRKRIGIAGIFLLGAFGIVTGAVKISEAYIPGKRSPSWGNTAMWSTIHSGVGILCACLPVLWPVLLPLSVKVLSGTHSLRNLLGSFYNRATKTGSYARGTRQSGDDVVYYPPRATDTELLAMPKQHGTDVISNHSRTSQTYGNDSFEQPSYETVTAHSVGRVDALPYTR